MDPRIGQLTNGKFYAYVDGYGKEPVVGMLTDVEIALGLTTAEPTAKLTTAAVSTPKRKPMHTYQVTVTPRHKLYTGSHVADEYVTEVYASTGVDAVKKARKEWNENNSGNAATYRAKRK